MALALDLSEEAVRQRLARGRKLLQEQVIAFVKSALERTSPKPAFTQNVLAALPAAAGSGKAAGAAWAAAGPLGGVFAMLGGAWISWRAKVEATKSPRERRFVAWMTWIQVALLAAALAVSLVAMEGGFRILRSPLVRDLELSSIIFLFWAALSLQFLQRRRQFQIQHEDKTFDETEWRLRRTGLGIESNTGSAPSFWLLLKRGALGIIFFAIIAIRVPPMHTPLMLVLSVGFLLLVVFLNWIMLRREVPKNPPPTREPHLGFMAALAIALTFLAIYAFPPARTWNASLSIREMALLNAAVILAYA